VNYRHAMAALLVVTGIASVTADTFDLSFGQHAASNVFQTRYAERDFISALEFSLTKDLRGISLLAGAGMDYFSRNPGLSFASATTGIDAVVPVGMKSGLYLAGTAEGVFFRGDYSDFSHLSLDFLAGLKSYVSQSSIAKGNYDLEYRKYTNGIFDFISQSVALSIDKFFPSNTTFKASAGWGYKYFLHPFVPEETAATGGGAGGRRGPGPGTGSYAAPGASGSGQGIQSLSLSALLAQSLGSDVGLSLTLDRQWTISGRSPFLSVEETYLAENPTYDRFAWEGWGLSGVFTAQIIKDTEIKLSYTLTDRRFPGIESLSLEGTSLGITRSDRRNQADFKIGKDFRRFTIFLACSYVDNRSSSPLFDWKGVFVSGGIQWNAPFGRKR
jgi:hypothetical protein